MKVRTPTGLDFLGARLHGRRSRLAEADRLDTLCRIRAVSDLVRALESDTAVHTVVDLQRRLVLDLVREILAIGRQVDAAAGDLMDWFAVRFQVENLKVLARAFVTKTPIEQVRPFLMPLEGSLAVDVPAITGADTIEAFGVLMPYKPLRAAIHDISTAYRSNQRSFFIEAALDRGYLLELLARVAALTEDEQGEVVALIRQEVDLFHLTLVTRGKFVYGMKAEQLLPFHVRGSALPRERFAAMLGAADVADVAAQAVGRVIDAVPRESGGQAAGAAGGGSDPSILEVLAWHRYLRLANTTFRRSHMGLGAVVAFAAVRRIEVANLITLSEGIRTGVAPDVLRRRLIPRSDMEATRV